MATPRHSVWSSDTESNAAGTSNAPSHKSEESPPETELEELLDHDHSSKKKRAELWQDAEMDALVAAYRQIHVKITANKGRHVFKSANEKWNEVRNLLLSMGVDRQAKEVERKWSNLMTGFKQIVEWNKQGQPSYWDMDEFLRREKVKSKELPSSFRIHLFEAMSEFLGDVPSKKTRNQNIGMGAGSCETNECCISASGSLDFPLPMGKLSCPSSRMHSTDAMGRKQVHIVLLATGSFNPPTYMHLRMFELARDALVSEGYSVLAGYMSPVNDGYGKKGLAYSEHRLKMCELATADSSFIMVDPWEAKQNSYQRTLTVLKRVELSVHFNGLSYAESVRVMLLCGADLLESFSAPGVWIPEQVKAICHDHGIVCISRGGKDVAKIIFENDILYENKRNIIVVDELIENNISSTKVRQCLARGLSVKYLLPDSVIEYIGKHQLYYK